MDHRVATRLADREPYDIIVTERMSVADAVRAILANLGGRKLSRLTLISHGYATLVEGNRVPAHGVSVVLPGPANFTQPPTNFSRIYGGYGLEFGSDNLGMGTVASFGRLHGAFTEGGMIVIFGCAAAEKGPYLGERLSGDGPALMRALAGFAGAPVRASDSLQDVPINWMSGAADRGPWRGRTIVFLPDGRQVDESTLGISVY